MQLQARLAERMLLILLTSNKIRSSISYIKYIPVRAAAVIFKAHSGPVNKEHFKTCGSVLVNKSYFRICCHRALSSSDPHL